ncbi:MAG TPA: toll/interleukin-1 receptor domain-containing protein, partial [Sphingomicrobium sp.]|nr:toll/interleukin-1 receptor domain-containing protein [Sphingomicrobium sp.]
MADVFVSYARADERVARTIAEHLMGSGFSAWWDSDLLPHNSFASVIEQEIQSARAVLVIWSQASIKSQWVRAEAELARGEGKLIQVAIDRSPIPLPFNQYQTADLRHWRGDPADVQWRKVLASVAHFKDDAAAGPQSVGPTGSQPFRKLALSRRTRVLLLAGTAVLVLAGGSFALVQGLDRGPVRGARIAVQPFRTIGSAPALSDFAAELSNSLQDVLTQDQLQT